MAVVNGDPDQVGRLSIQATRSDSILAVEPERVVYAAVLTGNMLPGNMLPEMHRQRADGGPAGSGCRAGQRNEPDYLRGYRDGFDHAAGLCFDTGERPCVGKSFRRTAAI